MLKFILGGSHTFVPKDVSISPSLSLLRPPPKFNQAPFPWSVNEK